MTAQSILTVLVSLAVVGLIVYRQLHWRRFDAARVLRLPLVLGALGVVELVTAKQPLVVGAVDVALLVVELAIALGVGSLMGRLAVFRPAAGGGVESRTGGLGAALWIVLVAVRLGIDVGGAALGAHLAVMPAVSLLVVAVTRGTAALVTRARAPQPVGAPVGSGS